MDVFEFTALHDGVRRELIVERSVHEVASFPIVRTMPAQVIRLNEAKRACDVRRPDGAVLANACRTFSPFTEVTKRSFGRLLQGQRWMRFGKEDEPRARTHPIYSPGRQIGVEFTPAALSSRSSVHFQPLLSSRWMEITPWRSDGISTPLLRRRNTRRWPSAPKKYPSSKMTFWRARLRSRASPGRPQGVAQYGGVFLNNFFGIAA